MRLNIRSKYRKIYGGLHLPKDLWEITDKEERVFGRVSVDHQGRVLPGGNKIETYTYTNKQDRNLTIKVESADFAGAIGLDMIERRVYFYDGKKHREDGPALIEYSKLGKPLYKEWWRDGKQIDMDD
jgi:hypothetical protein